MPAARIARVMPNDQEAENFSHPKMSEMRDFELMMISGVDRVE
jgi:hypothetical protein